VRSRYCDRATVGDVYSRENDCRLRDHLDDRYGQLAVIDIAAEAAEHEPWFNQTLTRVNDGVVR
jgi:hypothetical protein